MRLKRCIKVCCVYAFLSVHTACSDNDVPVTAPEPSPEVVPEEDDGMTGEKDLRVEVVSSIGVKRNGDIIPEEDMKQTYDGDRSTVLKVPGWDMSYIYRFGEEGKIIDYVIYHPYSLTGDYYGSWGKVDVSIMEEGEDEFKLLFANRDFGASELPTTLFFEGHKKMKAIKFLVKEGEQDNNGWTGCSEIEFYRQESPLFDPLILFKDKTCSDLKEGITEKEIAACGNSFYRGIAKAMFDDTYPREFRIQEFPAHPYPSAHAKENLINGFSLYENVTGIYVDKGDLFTVLVGDTHGESVSLKIIDLSVANGYSEGATFSLRPGFNQMEMPNKGLVYVAYHTDNYEMAEPIKIHFATGQVNGYFDVTKHTMERWPDMIQNCVSPFFDMVGRRSHITFAASDFGTYCDDPFALMEKYDRMMDLEEEFTGLKKYGRELKNKVYINFNKGSGGALAAADNHIVWNNSTGLSIPDAISPSRLGPWGVAHELGHELQIRPGRQRYQGMLEVTNNLLSIYVQLKFGEESRLFTSLTTPQKTSFQSEFERAMTYYGAEKRPHNYNMKGARTVLTKLIPLWQMYLYSYEVRGEDWFKDYYEELRRSSNKSANGDAQMDLIRIFCKVSQLNLLEFFEHTGFLTPMNDYTDNGDKDKFVITQDMIDRVVKEIEDKGYAKPDVQFWRLTDQKDNIAAFKEKKAVIPGTAIRQNKTFTMKNWQNVVAYEVYTNERLVFVSPHQSFTVEGEVNESTYVKAVSAIGEETKVTFN